MLLYRNLKKAINLTGRTINSGGAFSSYYKYNKTQGIKVLYSDGHRSIKALRNSQVWKRATRENTLLRKCKQRYYYIPQTFGVYPIKIGYKYYPGIVMQHIHGFFLEANETDNPEADIVLKKLHRQLSRKGIYHGDLHGENVIVTETNTCYVIDFTYDLIELDTGFNL